MRRSPYTLLVLAGLASPVGFLAANQFRSPSVLRLGVIIAFLVVVQVLFLLLAARYVPRQEGALSIAAGVLALTYIGLLETRLSLTPWVASLLGGLISVGIALAVFIAGRKWAATLEIGLWVLAALVLAPAMTMIVSSPALAQSEAPTKDVVVIILDGYGGKQTLMDLFDFANSEFEGELTQLGFEILNDATASYTMTYASIASILELEYAVEPGFIPDSQRRPELYRLMQGANAFVASAKSQGYRYVHLESGWGGTTCGPEVDECVRAPFLEETVWSFSQRTFLGPMMPVWFGHAFSRVSLDRIKRLGSLDLAGSDPAIIISHLLLPHPPLFLDSACRMRYSPYLDGMNIGTPWYSSAERSIRRSAYIDQVECTNQQILEILRDPEFADAIVVLVGDHGTDAQDQLVTQVSEWDDSMIHERLETLIAVRGCRGDIPADTINILRYVSNCAFGADLSMLEGRRFLVPVTENHPKDSVIEVPAQ